MMFDLLRFGLLIETRLMPYDHHENPVEERDCDMTQDQNEENKAIQDDEPDQFETPVTTEDNEPTEENAGETEE